jgi:hypothetical protein
MRKFSVVSIVLVILLVLSACTKTEGLTKNDFIFDINTLSIELDSDSSVLIGELGDDYQFSEAPSCVYDGTDKYYSYEDIEIYTYPLDNKDLIDEIVLLDPKYSTRRGIKVGDLLRMVEVTYGDDFVQDGDMITYRMDPEDPQSPAIYFMIEDDIVTSIHFYSASNILP